MDARSWSLTLAIAEVNASRSLLSSSDELNVILSQSGPGCGGHRAKSWRQPLEVDAGVGEKTRQRNDECDVIRTDRGHRRRETSEAVSNDSDPLRVHLGAFLEEGNACDQVIGQLLHRR